MTRDTTFFHFSHIDGINFSFFFLKQCLLRTQQHD
jgi:hypothetical protein